jgi:hypothetical protein
MEKWEYLVVPLDAVGGLKKGAAGLRPEHLNELSSLGREALGVSLKKGDLVAWPVVLLKRPVGQSTTRLGRRRSTYPFVGSRRYWTCRARVTGRGTRIPGSSRSGNLRLRHLHLASIHRCWWGEAIGVSTRKAS